MMVVIKNLLAGFLAILMFATPVLGAVDVGYIIEDPGAMPNSWTYGFKRFGEKVNLAFTFNQEKKAELQYEHALKRLGEANYMKTIGESEKAMSLMNEYQNQYAKMEATMTKLKNKGTDISSLENQIQEQTQVREQASKEAQGQQTQTEETCSTGCGQGQQGE